MLNGGEKERDGEDETREEKLAKMREREIDEEKKGVPDQQ